MDGRIEIVIYKVTDNIYIRFFPVFEFFYNFEFRIFVIKLSI